MTPVELSRTVLRAVRRAVDEGELSVAVPARVVVTPPGPGGRGDYATNIALQLARPAGRPPRQVAEILRPHISRTEGVAGVEITGPGFLNIHLDGAATTALVRSIQQGAKQETQQQGIEQGTQQQGGRRGAYGHSDDLRGEVVTLRIPYDLRAEVVADALVRIIASQGGRAEVEHAEPVNLRPVPAPEDPAPLGPDAARWALLHPAAHDRPRITADLLVQRASNPLFRVRYAHARSRALHRNAAALGFTSTPGDVRDAQHHLPERPVEGPVEDSPPSAPLAVPLVTALAEYPHALALATAHHAPDRLARHLVTVADALLAFQHTVLPRGEEKPSAAHRARLALAEAAGTVLAGGLSLLGIDAPDNLWTPQRAPESQESPRHVMSRSAHPAGPRHADVLPEGHYSAPPTDLNTLDPKVWAQTVTRGADGVVTVGGIDVKTLAEEFGTPAYFVDEADFRARARAWRTAFGHDADVFYAGKAFLSRAVVRWLHEEGLNLDVCSGGELTTALSAGMPADRIAFHGNNKSAAEIRTAVEAGVGRIVLDSFQEIVRVAHIAQELGKRQRVQIRVTVGVEAHTHEFIATAHEDQKFGIPLAGGQAAEAVRRALQLDGLELIGIHSHIGSQIFDTSGFEVAAHRVVGLLKDIRDEHGVELPEIDLGGGLGIAYTSDDDPREPHEIAKALTEIVNRECEGARLRTPRISVEPGRAIVGPTAFTLYEVGTIKPLDGLRTYVSVDGGMSDNIRTALYDAEYSVALVSRTSDAEPMLARVVGKHCESGDIVVKDAFLPADLAPGDLLAVPATGAYCRSMASNYNHALRPPVVAVNEGEARVIVRRETEEDLLRLDVG